jgi:hypothetical protein
LNTVSVVTFFFMLTAGQHAQYPQGHGMALSVIAIPGLALAYLIAQIGIKLLGGITLLIDLIRVCAFSKPKGISASFHPLALVFLPGVLLTGLMYSFVLLKQVRLLLRF